MPDPVPTYRDLVRAMADRHKVPEAVALTIFDKESSGRHTNPDGTVRTGGPGATGSAERALGFFQLLPSTAYGEFGLDPRDPAQNIEAGVRYIRQAIDRLPRGADGGVPTRDVLAYYHGGPNRAQWGPLTQRYADDGMAAVQAYSPARTAAAAVPTTSSTGAASLSQATGIRATPMDQRGFWDQMVQSFDPNEVQGRQNIGATVGSAVFGGLGMLGGPIAMRAGSAIGAGLGGGAAQLFEETGLGEKLAEWLPGETDEPPKPPEPGTTAYDRFHDAALGQVRDDLMGQGLGKLVGIPLKRLAQSSVGRYAFEHFKETRDKALAQLQSAVDALRTEAAEMQNRLAQRGREVTSIGGGQVRDARAAASDATAAAKAAADEATEAAERTAEEGVARARGRNRQEVHEAVLATRRGIASAEQKVIAAEAEDATARELAKAKTKAARGTMATQIRDARRATRSAVEAAQAAEAAELEGRAAAHSANIGRPPSEAVAGQAVSAVYEGVAKEARDARGRAITKAAEAGGDVDLRPLKAEAERILTTQILPPAQTFAPPVPPGAAAAATPTPGVAAAVGTPPPTPPLPGGPPAPPTTAVGTTAQAVQAITQAQTAQAIDSPVAQLLARILNAPDTGKFLDVHLFKSQLQQALDNAGAYDRTVRTQLENITMRLSDEMRERLKGNDAYDAATAAYREIAPLFTEGFADTIKSVARDAPEKIVQMLNPDSPTSAQMVVDVLTKMAKEGGGEAGEKLGQEALEKVQAAWVHRNILQGGLPGLRDRLTQLRETKPDFVDALLSTPNAQQLLDNAAMMAHAYETAMREAAARTAATRAAAPLEVDAARAAGQTVLDTAETENAKLLKTASETLDAARGEVRATGRTGRERVGELREAGRAEREALQAAGKESVEAVARTGDEATDAARRAGKADVAEVAADARAVKEADRQAAEAERLALNKEQQDAGIQLRDRTKGRVTAQTLPEWVKQIEDEAKFGKSTLGGKVRDPTEVGADVLAVTAQALNGYWRGMGAMRLLKGASDEDMLAYIAHSPGATRFFVRAMMMASRPGFSRVVGELPAMFLDEMQYEEEELKRRLGLGSGVGEPGDGSGVGAPPAPPPTGGRGRGRIVVTGVETEP